MTSLRSFLDAESLLAESAAEDGAVPTTAASAAEQTLGAELLAQHDCSPAAMRRQLAQDRGRREQVVAAWLSQQSSRRGQVMEQSYHVLAWLAMVVGLLLGFGAGRGALLAPAERPINLWIFLASLVFLQILLVVAVLAFSTIARLRGTAWIGTLGRLMRGLYRWAVSKRLPGITFFGSMPETAKVEQWICLSLTQRFAIAFNGGVLAAFLGLLFFSELQFSWSTTPQGFDPVLLETIVRALAAPWSWAAPESWVPSAAYIAGTRWDMLAGHFHDPGVDGRGWWPFLFLSLLTWGLLPRVLLYAWMRHKLRRTLATLGWNHRGYQSLFERLFPMSSASLASASGAQALPIEAATADATTTADAARAGSQAEARAVVLWGDWASSLAEATLLAADSPLARLGLTAAPRLLAGVGNPERDQHAARQLQGLAPQELWLLVEAGEAPDKRFTTFLALLRQGMDRETPFQVLPLESRDGAQAWPLPAARDLTVWSRSLGRLHDRHLHLSRLEGTS